jgi:proline iminopeptidase
MAADSPAPVSGDAFATLTSEHLDVGDGHTIYVESVGCTDGIPAVYLHGGPGSGCQPDHRRLFDPQRFHTVLFDQRGAGRSKPKGCRAHNTLPHLIADMETIRRKFGFDKWLVVGGSWGATLALAYAQAHPAHVSGIVLRATFFATREDLHDVFNMILPRHYPDLHADYLSVLPEHERSDPIPHFYRRILDADPAVHAPAIRAWGGTEAILSEVAPKRTRLDRTALSSSTGPMPATPAMEAHYFSHDAFMRPQQLMEDAGLLAGIPGVIVQGRYDLLCPPAGAHALAARWTDADLRIIEGAGHSLYDPGIRDAVMKAIADVASKLK